MKLKSLHITLILLLFFSCKNNSRFDFFGEKKNLTNLDSYNFKINEMGPNNIKGEITIITISHSFYTIKECDHIFLVKNGTISSKGSYRELLEKSEDFNKMEKEISNN